LSRRKRRRGRRRRRRGRRRRRRRRRRRSVKVLSDLSVGNWYRTPLPTPCLPPRPLGKYAKF